METIKTSSKICKKCKYSCAANGTYGVICDYYLETGNHRGCKPGECNKYEFAEYKPSKSPWKDERLIHGTNFGEDAGKNIFEV